MNIVHVSVIMYGLKVTFFCLFVEEMALQQSITLLLSSFISPKPPTKEFFNLSFSSSNLSKLVSLSLCVFFQLRLRLEERAYLSL